MPIGALTLMLLGAVAAGKQANDSNCRDDRGVNRCAAEQQRRMHELYGAATIEEHARRGDEVRRAFYVDGYGRDLALISFIRSPGKDIELEVRTPRREGEAAAPLQANVPLAAWQAVQNDSRFFDRKLAPAPAAAGDARDRPVAICLHSWVYTVEASDRAAQGGGTPQVRKAVEDACENGLTAMFANDLAQVAVTLLPPCTALDASQHRNAATRLAACTQLSGDRIAAAQAMNAFKSMRFERGETTPELRAAFGHRTTFEWDGRTEEKEWQAAGPFWAERLQSLGANFYPARFHGENSGRVRVEGMLVRQGGEGQPAERAPAEMIWGWEPSQRFAIQRIKLGAFAAAR